MLKKLRLEQFKNFKDAELTLGPFTLLIGANASGKSNLRDALRFLHGIGRGYTLAEIMGGAYVGGALQWSGIRGGTREISFQGTPTFALEVEFAVEEKGGSHDAAYRIEVDAGLGGKAPRVVAERLVVEGHGPFIFASHLEDDASSQRLDPKHTRVWTQPRKTGPATKRSVLDRQPALSQMEDLSGVPASVRELAKASRSVFRAMRFYDFRPEAMREPSLPGQVILGERGENLASVLQAIAEDPDHRAALAGWIQALAPMDVQDLEFPADPAGRVLLTLVEENGQRTSAYSASDGILRLLAMLAALRGPEPASISVFEELADGIHPVHLHLILELINQKVGAGKTQVVASTHSPSLLTFVRAPQQEYVSLVYRLEHADESHIRRALDIPDLRRILETDVLGDLHASGWFETVMLFDAAPSDEAAA